MPPGAKDWLVAAPLDQLSDDLRLELRMTCSCLNNFLAKTRIILQQILELVCHILGKFRQRFGILNRSLDDLVDQALVLEYCANIRFFYESPLDFSFRFEWFSFLVMPFRGRFQTFKASFMQVSYRRFMDPLSFLASHFPR